MEGSARKASPAARSLLIVAGVLADIAAFVGGRTRAMAEEMFRVEPEIVEGTQEIDGEGAVGREVGGSGFAIGPEAVIEDLRHDAAVGVVPAGDAGGIAGVDGVLKDGLVLTEGRPLAGGWIFERESRPRAEMSTALEGMPVKRVGTI